MSRCINCRGHKRLQLALWAAGLVLATVAGSAAAGTVWLPGAAGFGGVNVSSVQSLKARSFSRTIQQQYDFSCGSAAVATLLTYQYHDPVSEQTVFRAMWERGDQEKIRQLGFSLLDIKSFLQARGYQADGYEVPLDKLEETHVPAIVLINDHGYNHFVVVKGLGNHRVLVGDPSRGARAMPRDEFIKLMSNSIVFVITSDRGQAIFNGHKDWATRPLAPLGSPTMMRGLARATVMRPGPSDF